MTSVAPVDDGVQFDVRAPGSPRGQALGRR